MKKLTKEQLKQLYGYKGNTDKKQALHNGETGYCKEEKIIVICCVNCGDYSRIKAKPVKD